MNTQFVLLGKFTLKSSFFLALQNKLHDDYVVMHGLNYTFFDKNAFDFNENKMYYRERVTILPRTRYDTTENALRSIFHKVPQN